MLAVRVDHFTRFDHMGVHWGNIEYKPFVEEHRANVMSIPYEHLVDVWRELTLTGFA